MCILLKLNKNKCERPNETRANKPFIIVCYNYVSAEAICPSVCVNNTDSPRASTVSR